MVFQDYNLWPNKTILENIIEAPCHVKNIPKAEAVDRAKVLCEKFDIGNKLHDYPISLSGGQRQRAAFARALAVEPEVLLLDEVTSALDPEMVGEILDLIMQLKISGYTMVIVTHHLGFARSVSDEIVFLADRMVVERGDADKVLSSPTDPRIRDFVNSLLAIEPSTILFDIRGYRDIPEITAKETYNSFDLDRIRRQVLPSDGKAIRYQMESKSPFVRLLAYNLYREHFTDEYYDILMREYRESNDPYFKIPLIYQILAKFIKESDVAEFLQYVKAHPEEFVKHNLEYFGGRRSAVNFVRSRIKKPDHYAKRFLNTYLLGFIGDEGCIEDLEALVRAEDGIVRQEALAAIESIRMRSNQSAMFSNTGR
jgi:ABC-type oligopeptide transport system ATPase subunit